MFENVIITSVSPKTNLKRMLLFGVLAALSSFVQFSVPGAGGGASDAREIILLIGLVFLSDWRYALGMGMIASLSGTYVGFPVTFTIHMVGIPVAWFVLKWLWRKIEDSTLLGIAWFAFVPFLYLLVFLPVFLGTGLITGMVQWENIAETYRNFLSGLVLEIFITAAISSLAISMIHLQLKYEETANYLNMAVESAEIGLWHWDIVNDIRTINKQWASQMGYSIEEFKVDEKVWEKALHPDDHDQVLRALKDHLEGKTDVYRAEYRLRNRSGEYRWIYAKGKVLQRDNEGKALSMSGIQLDITEIKQLEDKNARLREEIHQAQKMESIGILAGGVAHDFNNILTVINGYADISLRTLDEKNNLYENIRAILEAGKKAENLTRQLLAFSRKQIFKTDIIDINYIIEDMDKMIRRIIGEDIQIQTVFDRSIPKIKADKSQLEQIFLNLVINSRDAVYAVAKPEYKKIITIETGKGNISGHSLPKNEGQHRDNYIFFSVSDNGIGMDSATLEKIFDPFFTTKGEAEGTGLGLSTVYGIVKQNNGHIFAYSEPGKGTTIKIYWPVPEEKLEEEKRTTSAPPAEISGTETVLLVEDDPEVCKFARNSLLNLGYKVVTADNGKKGLKIIESRKYDFHIIVTDLIMPELSGKEFIEHVQKIMPDIKVVYVSGYTDRHIVHNGMLDDGIVFLHKPYSAHDLAGTIRKVLDS